jgi:CRP-like cAMP-binding protein
MEVLTPQPLKDYLQAKARIHHLTNDMVLFYAGQIPMTAVWLHQGTIRFNFEMKLAKDYTTSGLYFLEELSRQKDIKYSAKILTGSKIWLVTRSELEEFLLTN